MKFNLTDDGTLEVTAETKQEVMEVFRHYRLADSEAGVMLLAETLPKGTYIHRSKSAKRPWFQVDVYLNRALEPYRKLLERITGYDGQLPDMELTKSYPDRLCHTHITNTCEIVDGMYHAEVFIQAEEWNGQTAEVRAQKNAEDYVQETIGKRKHEREYIPARNGGMMLNPDYMKRHNAEPGTGAPWLWARIFDWWREMQATDEQRKVLVDVDALSDGNKWKRIGDRDYDIRKGGDIEAHLVGFSFYTLDPMGTCDWDGKGTKARVWTWEEFKALGQKKVSA